MKINCSMNEFEFQPLSFLLKTVYVESFSFTLVSFINDARHVNFMVIISCKAKKEGKLILFIDAEV